MTCHNHWCWEGLGAEGEKGVRGWDGWMSSLIQWTQTWANSGRRCGMGGLACCSPWGCKGSDTTGRLNNSNPNIATGLLPMMLKFLACLSFVPQPDRPWWELFLLRIEVYPWVATGTGSDQPQGERTWYTCIVTCMYFRLRQVRSFHFLRGKSLCCLSFLLLEVCLWQDQEWVGLWVDFEQSPCRFLWVGEMPIFLEEFACCFE